MGAVSRFFAILVMGAAAFCVVGIPSGMSIISSQIGGSQSVFSIVAPFVAIAVLTILIAMLAPTARIAWGRLCVLNGLASFALPFQGLLLSTLIGSLAITQLHNGTAGHSGAEVGAMLGAGAFGVALTSALAFVGFFLGMIFVVAGYFILRAAPRSTPLPVAR